MASLRCALYATIAVLPWFHGCVSLVDRPDTAQEITAADFSAVKTEKLDIVQVPSEVFTPEGTVTSSETVEEGRGETVKTTTSLIEKAADGSERDVAIEVTEDIRIKPGDRWTVESLVGQINGRPVYASQFLQPIEDRIMRIVAENPRATALRLIGELVAERFEQYINNELIIAEAEGMLTPDMQLGILAWLDSIQQQTVAGYGGNLAEASQTLQDQFGMTMEEYLRQKRDEGLAQDLLRRRVKPRTIVSWRDIEREYLRFEKQFNPAPTIWIGRLRVTTAESELLKDVEARIERKESFAEIAAAMALPDGGIWQKYELPPTGIAGLPLADDIKSLLAAVPAGQLSEPSRKPSSVTWYCVTKIETQAPLTLYNPMLQTRIRAALVEQRGRREQYRYLNKLRDRWVNSDILQMTRRLTVIACERYLPKA
ncbi:MAG: hypothetical protein EXS03_00900 [Phycisphaerales bacterium]|nr:hypothetical protein [Phycisphaerales bacterium]